MIQHSQEIVPLTHPWCQSGSTLKHHSRTGINYSVVAALAKPYLIPLVNTVPDDLPIDVYPVIGFPHGNSPTKLKIFQVRHALSSGYKEVHLVINVFKVQKADWGGVKEEIEHIHSLVAEHSAILKVMGGNDCLNDRQSATLLEICCDLGVAIVTMSDEYGFLRLPSGFFSYANTCRQTSDMSWNILR
jgi:deoxyribose-phosphate aldolase